MYLDRQTRISLTGKADPWLLLVNLGMIWCFGFFFLELLDAIDEESQQRREALASLDDVGRKLGSVPTQSV